MLLRFATPSPREALAQAQELVAELDPDFLWEVSGDDEFGFDELAREYYGAARRAAREAAAVALAAARPRRCTSTSAARAAIARRRPTR